MKLAGLLDEALEVKSKESRISKADVNAVLKDLGNEFVKWKINGKYSVFTANNKRFKGILAGSESPMDATSAGYERVSKKVKEIRNALFDLGLKQETPDNNILVANPDSKYKFTVVLYVEKFPSHSSRDGYDSDYKSIYILADII